uniref:Uncharacterized protein n=1 Tax=Anguilla anguilla TaxID=7936 RepID=A0A0E9S8I3_ANGAN
MHSRLWATRHSQMCKVLQFLFLYFPSVR